VHFIYTWLRPDPFIGPIAGGLAVIIWAAIMADSTALAGLRSGAPLIDDSLASVDAMLGLDAPMLVAWVARHSPVIWVLEFAYLSAVPLMLATVIVLGLTRRESRLWEFCLVFVGSVLTCAFLSALMPAAGIYVHYRIPPEILALLPASAGRFYLPVFEAYRSGAVDTVYLHRLEGVVTFPSFHAVMALMAAYALSGGLRWLSGPVWAWSGLILISTIPIGGHYATDLVAGAAVWAAFTFPVQIRKGLLRLSERARDAQGVEP
jgi:membrane-associated phospholipid phosphatase